jgi:hypothetical protein
MWLSFLGDFVVVKDNLRVLSASSSYMEPNILKAVIVDTLIDIAFRFLFMLEVVSRLPIDQCALVFT